MFREVNLPENIAGRLYLHSMPGRHEPLEDIEARIRELGITVVVCLAPLEEIEKKSPNYAAAIRSNDQEWQQMPYPIPDYGAPEDKEDFLSFVRYVSVKLKDGERILMHCGAGYGRTGMAAMTLLMVLGLAPSQAMQLVSMAGSEPERASQYEFLQWAAKSLQG